MGEDANVWYDQTLVDDPENTKGYNFWVVDYTGEEFTPVKLKENKKADSPRGFVISGDLGDDKDDVIIGSPWGDKNFFWKR